MRGPPSSHRSKPQGGRPGAEELLAVPAWYDPKRRRLVFAPETFQVGLLVMTKEAVAYVTDAGVQFEGRLAECSATWPKRAHLTRGCDLRIAANTYRLYFARPMDGAPRFRTSDVSRIADTLGGSGSQVLGLLGGSIGQLGEAAGIVGMILSAPAEFSEQRQGIRNGDAVRERLASTRAVERQPLP